jgi:Ca-activated chloride channel homolog
VRASLAIAAIIAASCAGAEHRPARDRYNAGVAALAQQHYEEAEKALLEARDQARVDPELRYRAAFNLGVALAAHADQLRTGKPPDTKGALDKLNQAAGWFNDALRLRTEDPDALAALARVMARSRALADELARGDNGLEPRLDRLIDDQRKLRDGVEQVWLAVDQAGARR